MLNPIKRIIPDFQGQTLTLSLLLSPAPGFSFSKDYFCDWCEDTLMVTQSEGPFVYTTDCEHCADPFAGDSRILWEIANGKAPELEGV